MSLTLEAMNTVAEKPAEGTGHEPTETVRLPSRLVEMARVVCAHKKVDGKKLKMTAYLESMVGEQITRDHEEVLQAIADQQAKKKKGGKS